MVTWTAFSEAYASIMLTLFVPLTIAALGIVFRGASFAFRKSVVTLRNRRLFGAAFAASSVLVPYCMGAVAGGIASGRVPAGGKAGDPVDSWINPTSIVTGILAVAAVAYLAAVYLVWEARRDDDAGLAEYFRRRAVVSAVVVAVVGRRRDVRAAQRRAVRLRRHDRTGASRRHRRRRSAASAPWSCSPATRPAGARALAVLAVAGLVIAWGVAQWPYLLPESLTVSDAAAPTGTLQVLVVAVVARGADRGARVRPALRPRPSGACCRRKGCRTPPTRSEQPRRLTSSRHFISLG